MEKAFSEDEICKAFATKIRWLISHNQIKPRSYVWFHIPNEQPQFGANKRLHIMYGKKLKTMGRLPGVWDYIFIWRNIDDIVGTQRVVFIEFKKEKPVVRNAQEDFGKVLSNLMIPKLVTNSVLEAILFLREHGFVNDKILL